MQKPQIPKNEKERQAALDSYQIINSLPEQSFDDLTLIASQICDTPIALVSLIDNNRQWFKSKFGLEANETDRDISFCGHAINEPHQTFEINNVKEDKRFADNPLVTGDLNIGFYAGVPLINSSNMALGTLCVIDQKPRQLSDNQRKALEALAREVMNRIELRKKNKELNSKIKGHKEALDDSQLKYYKLYHQAPDMMVSIDAKTKKIIECNETLFLRLGYSQHEILGKEVFDLYHPDCLQEVEETFKTFVSHGVVRNKRLILKSKNGTKINVALNVTAVKDEDGNILYSNSIWRDIDDLIKVEKELKHLNRNLELEIQNRIKELHIHKERLELALEGSKDGILDWININEDSQWWSPSFYEMLGYIDKEIKPKMSNFLNALLHPEDLAETRAKIQDCLKDGAPFDVEFRLKTKTKDYKWYRGRGDTIMDKEGHPTRMSGSISDINEQKMLELKLTETQNFLKRITDIAPSIIYVFNQKTMSNEYANRELGSVLGYSIEEIQDLGSNLMPALCHPDDLNDVFAHFQSVSKLNGNETASIEYRMKHKDGGYRWLLSEDTSFERDAKGELVKQLGVATDITEIKEAQQELSAKASLLQKRNEDLKQFTYIATHDLKSPLITIKAYFKILTKEIQERSPKVALAFKHIEKEIEKFTITQEGLTDAIKIREDRFALQKENASQLLQEIAETYDLDVAAIGGSLNTEIEQNLFIATNVVYFKSILQNLISNAIKYRSEKRALVLDIIAKKDKEKLCILIKDNGLGIDLKLQQNRIFGMFNRFHNHSEGSGMGLYIVKSMVEKLKGSISIESEVDKGTCFYITLKLEKS